MAPEPPEKMSSTSFTADSSFSALQSSGKFCKNKDTPKSARRRKAHTGRRKSMKKILAKIWEGILILWEDFLIGLNALLFLLLRKLDKASDKKFEKEFEEMVRKNREE
jgi:hypothetical protein